MTAPALAAGPTFAAGDLVVVGITTAQARWVRSDGTAVRSLQPRDQGVPFGSIAADRYAPVAAAFAPDGTPYVADAGGVVRRYDHEGNLLGWFGLLPEPYVISAIARAPNGVLYVASTQRGGTNIIAFISHGGSRNHFSVRGEIVDLDVASDSCTLYYVLSSGHVRRINACALGQERPEFATNFRATAVRLLPDGTMLLAGLDGAIRRINPSGGVVRKYPAPAGSRGWTRSIDLAPDAQTFWASTRSTRVYRVELSTGRQIGAPISGDGVRTLDIAVLGAPHGAAPVAAETPRPEALDVDGVFPLTDEVVSTIQSASSQPTNACGNDIPGSAAYAAAPSGRAVGPYDGSFQGQGRLSFGAQTGRPLGLLGLPSGTVSAFEGSFAVTSPQGVVRGTLALPKARERSQNTAACARFAGRSFPNGKAWPPLFPLSGHYFGLDAQKLRYDATIEKNGRIYRDRGTSRVFVDEYYVTNPDGSLAGLARRYTQTWISESFGLTDSFSSRAQVRAHSAGLGQTTDVVELTLSWRDPRARFAVSGVRLVGAGTRTLQSTSKLKPREPKIEVVGRTRFTLKLRVTRLKASTLALKKSRLSFQVKPIALAGAALVAIDVRRR